MSAVMRDSRWGPGLDAMIDGRDNPWLMMFTGVHNVYTGRATTMIDKFRYSVAIKERLGMAKMLAKDAMRFQREANNKEEDADD